jgi:hypothetical protein
VRAAVHSFFGYFKGLLMFGCRSLILPSGAGKTTALREVQRGLARYRDCWSTTKDRVKACCNKFCRVFITSSSILS